MKILLVEDDWEISQLLAEILNEHQYVVDIATDGQAGWDFVKACNYDLILLDLGLPKLDGLSFCSQLRAKDYRMPILMLTARDTSAAQVAGLDAGADDYVIKPYKLEELLARIRALLRRKGSYLSTILNWKDLCLDPSSCQVTYKDRILKLTPKEYRLLELFLRNGNRVLSRSTILDNLWSFDEPPEEDAIKALIKRLRKKLTRSGIANEFIETVYGLGYRLNPNL
jgi:DNA-binding response OmpR family regulator